MKELLYLKDDQLKGLIEKLFVSYRETFSDSKKILDKYSIGIAHHKVIHLISSYEGISISDLLKKLKVQKKQKKYKTKVRKKYKNFLIITPGIRLPGDSSNDQRRIMTPKDAFKNKVSGIVLGRSLTKGDIKNNIKNLIFTIFISCC